MGLLNMPPGFSGPLTPDQLAMQQQQGWFPNPDMSLPAGVANTQPQGYSGLTPAQVATQQGIGYYTGTPQNQSLWDKLMTGVGSGKLEDIGKAAQGMQPQPRPGQVTPPPIPAHYGGAYNPYRSIYRPPLPMTGREALAALMRGNY